MRTLVVVPLLLGCAACAQPLLRPPGPLSARPPLEVEASWPGPSVRFGPYTSVGGELADGRGRSLALGPYHGEALSSARRLAVTRGDEALSLDCRSTFDAEGAKLGSTQVFRQTTELRCRVGAEGELVVRRATGDRRFSGHLELDGARLDVRSVHAAEGTLESWSPVGFVFEREGEAVGTAQVAYRRAVWLGALEPELEHGVAAAMTALLVHDLSDPV